MNIIGCDAFKYQMFMNNNLKCVLCRITTTVACNMDLTKYPMDKQTCTLQLESCKKTHAFSIFYCGNNDSTRGLN